VDAWETWYRQVSNALATARRVRDEGGDPGAVDAVVDYLQEASLLIQKNRPRPIPEGAVTFPTNGREGMQTVASQIDPIIANLEETGRLAPVEPAPDPSAVFPFLPPHLVAAYMMNQPTGDTE
jgi:hypothetical protein